MSWYLVDVGEALVELDSTKSLELCCVGGVDLMVRLHSPVVLELSIVMVMILEHYSLVEVEPVYLELLVVFAHDGVCSQGMLVSSPRSGRSDHAVERTYAVGVIE